MERHRSDGTVRPGPSTKALLRKSADSLPIDMVTRRERGTCAQSMSAVTRPCTLEEDDDKEDDEEEDEAGGEETPDDVPFVLDSSTSFPSQLRIKLLVINDGLEEDVLDDGVLEDDDDDDEAAPVLPALLPAVVFAMGSVSIQQRKLLTSISDARRGEVSTNINLRTPAG